MKLQYEITGVVSSQLRRALQSVEGETVASAQRTERKVTAIRQRSARQQVTGFSTRENQKRVRAIANEGRARRREDQASHRRRLALIAREEQAEIAAARRAANAKVATERRAAASKHRARVSMARGALRGGYGAARGVLGYGGGILGLGTGFAAVGAIRNEMGVTASASTLANKAFNVPGETRTREQIRAGIVAQAKPLGISTGLGTESVIGGLSQFHAIAGRLGVGQAILPFLTQIADATGADIGDVGRTAGQIVQALGTRGLSESQMINESQSIMAGMAGQAKVGSIEFADLATQMGKVMSATSGFDGKVSDLTKTMGAVAQLAISGAASSPEEAMTAILRFRDDAKKNQHRFAKHGINVFADKGRTKMRDPMEIISAVLSKTQGDLVKSGKLFGIRGMKAFEPFQTAFVAAGGGKSGAAAVMELLDSIKGNDMSVGEVKASAAFRREDPDKKFSIAVEKFNRSFGERLLPAVTQAIPKFEGLIPVLGDVASGGASLASWFMDNPFKGIGAIVAAGVAKDVASAAVGKSLISSFGGKGGLVVGSVALTAGVVVASIDSFFDSKEKGHKQAIKRDMENTNLLARASAEKRSKGELSAGTRKALMARASSMLGATKRDSEIVSQGYLETAANSITGSGPGFSEHMQAAVRSSASGKTFEQTREMLALLGDAAKTAADNVVQMDREMLLLKDTTASAAAGMSRITDGDARTSELLYR